MNLGNSNINKILRSSACMGKRYISVLSALILVFANLHFINEFFITSNKSTFSVIANDDESSITSTIRSNLISIRSCCSISEGVINDSPTTVNNTVNARNNFIYAKYLYSQAITRLNETIDILNSTQASAINKVAEFNSALQNKQTEINQALNSLDNLIASLDRQGQPSQIELDKLKSSSSSLTAYFNSLIELNY